MLQTQRHQLVLSEQLNELTSGSVSPAGVLRHDGSTHGAGGVPVEPGGHAVLAEDVLAVEHGGLLEIVLTYRTEPATGLHLLFCWSFPVTEINDHVKRRGDVILDGSHLVDCISFVAASLQSLMAFTKIFPLTTM